MKIKYMTLVALISVVFVAGVSMAVPGKNVKAYPQGWTNVNMTDTALNPMGELLYKFKAGQLLVFEKYRSETDLPSFSHWTYAPDATPAGEPTDCYVYLDHSPVVSHVREYDARLVDSLGNEITRTQLQCPTVYGDWANWDHQNDAHGTQKYHFALDIPGNFNDPSENISFKGSRVEIVEKGTNIIRQFTFPLDFGVEVWYESPEPPTIPNPDPEPSTYNNHYTSYECHKFCVGGVHMVPRDNCMEFYGVERSVDKWGYYMTKYLDIWNGCRWV